eukprot:scaffold23647_cov60-Phaeocystis_antarctica.AAC.3
MVFRAQGERESPASCACERGRNPAAPMLQRGTAESSANKRYPGRLELRWLKPPRGTRTSSHTCRHPHGDGWEGQPSGPPMGPDQSVGPGGLATPGTGGCLRALPQQSDALLAFRADGGVVWPTDGAPRPPRVVFVISFASLIIREGIDNWTGAVLIKCIIRGKTAYTHSPSPSRPPNNTLNTRQQHPGTRAHQPHMHEPTARAASATRP